MLARANGSLFFFACPPMFHIGYTGPLSPRERRVAEREFFSKYNTDLYRRGPMAYSEFAHTHLGGPEFGPQAPPFGPGMPPYGAPYPMAPGPFGPSFPAGPYGAPMPGPFGPNYPPPFY